MKKLLILLIITLFSTACGTQLGDLAEEPYYLHEENSETTEEQAENAENTAIVQSHEEPPTEIIEISETETPHLWDLSDFPEGTARFTILEEDGQTAWAWWGRGGFTREDIYRGESDIFFGTATRTDGDNPPKWQVLATFSPVYLNGVYNHPSIWDFGRLDGWLILSVGFGHHDADLFSGSFVRMREDGSQQEEFWATYENRFWVADGWFYYNFWKKQGDNGDSHPRVHRMRADGSEWEDLGDFMSNISDVRNGILYGRFVGENSDFISFDPATGDITTLFNGGELPTIEGVVLYQVLPFPNPNNTRFSFPIVSDFSVYPTYLEFVVQIWENNLIRQGWSPQGPLFERRIRLVSTAN